MEKLIEKFNDEVAIKSKLANFIWQFGIIINSIIYFTCVLYFKKNICIVWSLYLVIIILLFLISNCLFIKNAAKKMNIQVTILKCFSIPQIIFIYNKIDEFQKDWITKYCKKNKLNSIDKLNILRQELKDEKKLRTTQYINPIIIGTLLISIWEIAIEKIVDKVGFGNMLSLAFVLIIGVSIFIGWIKKIFIEDREFFIQYKKFSDISRLEELLLYIILKCKK